MNERAGHMPDISEPSQRAPRSVLGIAGYWFPRPADLDLIAIVVILFIYHR